MEWTEVEGKTVEEAIEKAQQILKVSKEGLEIEVLSNGSQGFLGLLGSKKARIKVGVIKRPEESKKEKAVDFLKEILRLAKIPATVTAKIEGRRLMVTIAGDGSGLLIGRRGQTLDALQFLANKVVNRDGDKIPVVVDTENYRHRREEKLVNIAHRLRERALRNRSSVATEPLNPQERRLIYLSLQNNPDVLAKSEGEGELKRVIISPRRQNQG
ncbi:MAG: protein jag [Deltaproteobacteria bacterium]|nr:protein jag [Deltaproteobacteria bacterium]